MKSPTTNIQMTDIQHLAECLWIERSRPANSAMADWSESERLLHDPWVRGHVRGGPEMDVQIPLWKKWARENLLDYLALACGTEIEPMLARRLENTQKKLEMLGRVALLCALDGSPERSMHLFRQRSSLGGGLLKRQVEEKDWTYYRLSWEVLSQYRVKSLGGYFEYPLDESRLVSLRLFQDGDAVLFDGDDDAHAVHEAMMAALHLRQRLRAYNEEADLAWPSRLHARIGIGFSWDQAVACLSSTWRDDILVHPTCLTSLGQERQELLSAAGVRAGPS